LIEFYRRSVLISEILPGLLQHIAGTNDQLHMAAVIEWCTRVDSCDSRASVLHSSEEMGRANSEDTISDFTCPDTLAPSHFDFTCQFLIQTMWPVKPMTGSD